MYNERLFCTTLYLVSSNKLDWIGLACMSSHNGVTYLLTEYSNGLLNRRAGTIFQQGVKVKNHLFDISEVSIF